MQLAVTWSSIDRLGSSRAVQSSFVFFFAVPIVVAAYSAAPELGLPLFDLPFSWGLLYVASLLVSLGNTVYFAFCPRLVRDYQGYTNFMRSGRGSSYMADQLRGYSPRSRRREPISDILDHLIASTAGTISVREEVLPLVKEHLEQPGAQVSQALFWVTYDIANNLRLWPRTVATFAYGLGLLLFSYAVAEKVWNVLSFLFIQWTGG